MQNKHFPRSKNVEVQQVTLKPGEVLYIPPFHYVHVETHDTMASMIDVRSPSLEQLILYEATFVDTKFGNIIVEPEERIVVAQVSLQSFHFSNELILVLKLLLNFEYYRHI